MGPIQFVDVTRIHSGVQGELGFLADWLSPEGKPLIVEERVMKFWVSGAAANVLDMDLTLTNR